MLADAKYVWAYTQMNPAEYLYDHADVVGINLPAVVRWLRADEQGREPDSMSQGGPRTGDDDVKARALAKRVGDRWWKFADYLCTTPWTELETSLIGVLIACAGSAALPLAEQLLCLGFKFQPDALNGSPLLAPIVDHFFRRFWIEKQLKLPNTKGLDALRCVLLWLSEKTGDDLQINWKPPAG